MAMELSRRAFLKASTGAAGATLVAQAGSPAPTPAQPQAPGPRPSGFDPADPVLKFDLVVAGGEVLDPSWSLRGRYDVGIKNGQIAALLPAIPPDRATHRIDVTGRLVTPGLVDLHAHYYHSMGLGLPADELVPITATMTGVSAGAAGDMTFSGLRRWVIPQTWTRRFAFVHISSIGLAAGLTPPEMLNIDYADVNGCAEIVAENGDLVLGRRPTWRSSI